jgi:hypothetical protein
VTKEGIVRRDRAIEVEPKDAAGKSGSRPWDVLLKTASVEVARGPLKFAIRPDLENAAVVVGTVCLIVG